MAPDLDALFGADAAPAPALHPALRGAVQALLAEAWPVARGELLEEAAGKAGRGCEVVPPSYKFINHRNYRCIYHKA